MIARIGPSASLTRLIVAANRGAVARLVAIAAGIMVGVAIFLLLFGAYNSFAVRSERSSAITNIQTGHSRPIAADEQLQPGEIRAALLTDQYRGKFITVLHVADAQGAQIKPPGIDSLPEPGTYVASRAFHALARQAKDDKLAERYGRPAGDVSPQGLEGPDSLVVVVGVDTASLVASEKETYAVSAFQGNAYQSVNYQVVALIGAVGTLIPALLLVSIATRLGAAQRAESYGTLRLIGATPRKVASLAAMETAATATLGAVLGVGLYFLVLPLAARVRMGTSSFYRSDLLVSPAVLLAVVVAVVLASVAVSWWQARRGDVGPVGVTRQQSEKPTSWLMALPLLCGIGLLGFSFFVSPSMSVLVVGLVACALGILILGPHLTLLAVRAARPFARKAAQVMALNRLARHPRSSFRSISGIMVALYLVTVFAVAITVAPGLQRVSNDRGQLPSGVLVTYLGRNDPAAVAEISERLERLAGVTAVAPGVRAFRLGDSADPSTITMSRSDAQALGLKPPGTSPNISMSETFVSRSETVFSSEPLMLEPTTQDNPGEPNILFIATDGQAGSIEQARGVIVRSGLNIASFPATRAENIGFVALDMRNQFATMGYTGILIVTGLSAISFAVSTFSSLIERRRVFGLLRLAGMPRSVVRRMLIIESLVPIVSAFVLSVGLGAFTAWVLVTSLTSYQIGWPDAEYFGVLALSLVLVLGAVALSLRSYSSLTRPDRLRFE